MFTPKLFLSDCYSVPYLLVTVFLYQTCLHVACDCIRFMMSQSITDAALFLHPRRSYAGQIRTWYLYNVQLVTWQADKPVAEHPLSKHRSIYKYSYILPNLYCLTALKQLCRLSVFLIILLFSLHYFLLFCLFVIFHVYGTLYYICCSWCAFNVYLLIRSCLHVLGNL